MILIELRPDKHKEACGAKWPMFLEAVIARIWERCSFWASLTMATPKTDALSLWEWKTSTRAFSFGRPVVVVVVVVVVAVVIIAVGCCNIIDHHRFILFLLAGVSLPAHVTKHITTTHYVCSGNLSSPS